ncbi:MAG: sugar kinase [Ostreibacterium sp.]
MKQIAILGEGMIELSGHPFADLHQHYGGDTLNTAIYLSRIVSQRQGLINEIKAHYVSALGEDPLSSRMLSCWQKEGLGIDWVLRDKQRHPGLYLIQNDSVGERTFMYWRSQSAARYLLQHLDFPFVTEKLATVDILYFSGISLAILPPPDRKIFIQLINKLNQIGVKIAFDSNFRSTLWTDCPNQQTIRNTYLEILKCCELALVTFDDEQTLWGDATPQITLARLQSLGVKIVVIKLGEKGCLYQNYQEDNSTTQHITTMPIKTVVDTTAAGDAFNAGFLAGYLTNADIKNACQQGNQLASVVIQHSGAIIESTLTAPVTAQFIF